MALNNSLEALYHFSGDANDDSGNGNNGTVTGATLTTDKNSVSNQAYDFDGAGDYIDCGTPLGSTTSVTVSLWAEFTATGSLEGLFGRNTGGNPQFEITKEANDEIEFRINDASGNTSQIETTTSPISTGWHHIVCVRDTNVDSGPTGMSVYIDSVLQTDTDELDQGTAETIDFSAINLFIGTANAGGDDMDGKIDEVRVYSRALTDLEVYQLYVGYDTDANKVGTLNEDIEALYHFSGDATDSSGNGNDGTVTGATLTTDKNSVSNQAYDFDGSNDYIELYDVDYSGDFSISVWSQHGTGTLSGNEIIFRQEGTHTVQFFANNGASEELRWNVVGPSTSFDRTVTGEIIDTSWHHYVMVRSGDDFYMYADGFLVDSVNSAVGVPNPTNNARLGATNSNSANWDGKIDECRVYSRALSDTEIVQLYEGYDTDSDCVDTTGTDLEAYYSFTGNANDDSGNGNNGTVNGATLTTDKNSVSNQAYLFDGTNDYVDTNFQPTGLTAFSVSCWIKHDDNSAVNEYFMGSSTGTGDADKTTIAFRISADESILMNARASDNTNNSYSTAASYVVPGTWYFICMTYDGTTIRYYIDGSLVSTDSVSNKTFNAQYEFAIGARNDKGSISEYFDGVVDEFRFYDRALTQDEITDLYDGYDVPANCPVTPSAGGKNALFLGGGL